jgi:hypothetical protein
MYSGEYDACDVTLSVYPHRASLKNMPDHGGNRTWCGYTLRVTSQATSILHFSYVHIFNIYYLRNLRDY